MKHFYDKVTGMSKHAVSCAAIVDSKGQLCGKIAIRYTDVCDGWNHELSVLLYDVCSLDNTSKGCRNSNPDTLYRHFRDNGIRCYDWNRKELGDYSNKRDRNADSLSNFSEIKYIKHGRKSYTLMWIL